MRTQRTSLLLLAAIPLGLFGCVNEVGDEGGFMGAGFVGSTDEEAMTAKCAGGSTVKGIDVSYYQGAIDWGRVKNDGVKFAFIRVSDGLGYHDSRFGANWSGAKAHGVLRGAYQFFRSNESAVAQADLLINKIGGHLGPDDLPPVIDVESADGQSAHTIATKVKAWLNRIHDKLGVNGIVYTGPYFWQDSVGGANLSSHPLWVAHYGTQCPLVPGAWSRWTFHQFTSSGRVAGIGGNVDTNHFNGTLAQLKSTFAGAGLPRACVSGHYRGAFCDDEGGSAEQAHNQLKNQLGVNFHCAKIAGSPAFCGGDKATRSQAAFVLGKAASIPLAGHPNAFRDDNNDPHERYLDAMKAYGIIVGYGDRQVHPTAVTDRNQLAAFLYRMYKLPNVQRDYFYDDDGSANEHIHNAVAAAGLMSGFADAHHTRRAFRGSKQATRSTLAVLAVRAHQRALVPVWNIPARCLSGNFDGAFCDDDGSSAAGNHDRLVGELGVDFSCRDLAGQPAFCPHKKATRAQLMYVLGAAAGVPLAGHADAFDDDDGTRYERYLNAASDYGVMVGFGNRDVRPGTIATRNTLAVVLSRMYALPPATRDYFTDDDGSANEAAHNRVAEAGLFTGYDDGHGGRVFKGGMEATRSMLATLAVRAHDRGLVPIWAR